MRIYSVKTALTEYTILSNSFDEAVHAAGRILEKEKKELYGSEESPEIFSIVSGDEIDEVPGTSREKEGDEK